MSRHEEKHLFGSEILIIRVDFHADFPCQRDQVGVQLGAGPVNAKLCLGKAGRSLERQLRAGDAGSSNAVAGCLLPIPIPIPSQLAK